MDKQILNYYFFVIIGPSGSGKTKVTDVVFDKMHKVISHTTRPIRTNEKAGKDYYFETKESFNHLISSNKLAEYDTYNSYTYGVSIESILTATHSHNAYDVLTINGFIAIERLFGDKVIPIYFECSKEKILERLNKRGSSKKEIIERLTLYEEEIQQKQLLKNYSVSYFIDADQSFSKVVQSLNEIIGLYQF